MVINMATLGMLICLLVMIFAGYGNIHVYILGGLGLGLLASVNWYDKLCLGGIIHSSILSNNIVAVCCVSHRFVHEMWAFERSQDDQRGSADRVASGDEKKDKQS